MFSHEGARRGKEFAVSSFAHQIAKGEKNGNCVVKHGNLDSVRTYSHIDDAIEAYWLCSESDKYGEVYNIGGNETCKVGDALDALISKSDKDFVIGLINNIIINFARNFRENWSFGITVINMEEINNTLGIDAIVPYIGLQKKF